MNKKRVNIKNEIYVCPLAAYKKMKTAQKMRQTVWIYAATGYGKTTFIKNYLKEKHYWYFSGKKVLTEVLESLLEKKNSIVVIDNFQDICDKKIIDFIEKLINKKDTWLIVSGRIKIPPRLVPVHLKKVFTLVSEEDLLLQGEEIKIYFEKNNLLLADDYLNVIKNLTKGYPLALRIIAIELLAGESLRPESIEKMKKTLWSYIEYHVYDEWEPEILEFLMQLSIVKQFDIRMAEMITGHQNVEKMIERAIETGNFIEERSGKYQFREAFTKSMQHYLDCHYSRKRRNNLFYNAGLAYELSGDFSDALAMYEKCGNKERICDILVSNSREHPGTGHYFELRYYYQSLPEEVIEQRVELLAGMSMLQSILLKPEESERWYQKLKIYAEQQTGSKKREARSWLVYLDIGLPHRGNIELIDILKNACTLLMHRKITLPEFSVTSNLPSLMNGGKDFCEWSKKDSELAQSIGKMVETVLGKHGKGLVSLALAESAFEKKGDNYQISNLANCGKMQAESGGKFELCFVAIGILSKLRLFNGNVAEARELLGNFKETAPKNGMKKLLPNIDAMDCRFALYQEDWEVVDSWMETAPGNSDTFNIFDRYRYLTKIRVQILYEKYDDAVDLLQRILYYGSIMKRTYIRMEAKLLLAIIEFRRKTTDWKVHFQEVLQETEEYHFVRLISGEGAAVQALLKAEQWQQVDGAFFKKVVKETEQMALSYPGYLKKRKRKKETYGKRALQILRLQAEGVTNARIGEKLGIKESTVKYHSRQTYKKLGVSNKAAAVCEAKRQKLI